jgi:hypothetical protein
MSDPIFLANPTPSLGGIRCPSVARSTISKGNDELRLKSSKHAIVRSIFSSREWTWDPLTFVCSGALTTGITRVSPVVMFLNTEFRQSDCSSNIGTTSTFEKTVEEPNCSSNFFIESRLSFSACLSRYLSMRLLFMVGPTLSVSAGVHLWVIPIRYRSRSQTVR